MKNFKSIHELDIIPNNGLNAFIGENSTGKSNIFKALDWLLGKSYPTFNQIKKEDHFMGDYDNKIKIILEFSDGMIFILDENEDRFKFQMQKGTTKFYNDIERKKYACAYLDTKREVNDYMPSNKWSLIGRILQEVNQKFIEERISIDGENKLKTDVLKDWLGRVKDKLLFSVKDNDGVNIMERLSEIIQHETSEQLNRKKEEFNIDFNLYDPWNFYKTLQITVQEQNGLEFQASSLGMGVQASISIAILKAYSELNLSNNSPILIDEPELYLHPQAQRNFYNILREVSIDTQIFYTTHSPDFLCTGNFDEIFLVRKSNINGTYVKNGNIKDFTKDLELRKGVVSTEEDYLSHMKVAYEETGDSQKSNEAFFANKVILVEGQSETLILPYLFKLAGFNYIKEGVTIVRCGGKTELDRFYRLYTEFGIPCFVIFDGDQQNMGGVDEDATIKKNKELFSILDKTYSNDFPDNNVNEKYLGFTFRLEENLGLNGAVGAHIKSLNLFKRVRNEVNQTNIPGWVNEVIVKVKLLKQDNIISVLKKEVQDVTLADIPF